MEQIYQQLAESVVQMRAGEVRKLALRVIEEGIPPEDAIQKGLAAGMYRAGELFAAKEYFVPEVLVCARAMYAGFDLLKDKVAKDSTAGKGAIVIGVVEGDHHDIGKNIVKLMLEASGFRLIDLGKNAAKAAFLDAVRAENADLVALSTLMTTTMESMEAIVNDLKSEFPNLKLMVGGAPVDYDFAESIGAHFCGKDAQEAVKGAHRLLNIEAPGGKI